MNLKNYIAELKRRNVFKAGLAYLIVAWIMTQVTAIVLPTFNAPPFVLKTILFILGIGFPIWLVFAWVYEITSEGIKKTDHVDQEHSKLTQTGNRFNKLIIASLSVALILLLINQFSGNPDQIENADVVKSTFGTNNNSIAVLAFEDMSQQKNQEYFSDGISAELTSLLAKIRELKVIDRRSSFSYKGKSTTAKQIGKELNISHILDGSVRMYDDKVRIDVQLIDVSDGSHLWLQTYDRQMDDDFQNSR